MESAIDRFIRYLATERGLSDDYQLSMPADPSSISGLGRRGRGLRKPPPSIWRC